MEEVEGGWTRCVEEAEVRGGEGGGIRGGSVRLWKAVAAALTPDIPRISFGAGGSRRLPEAPSPPPLALGVELPSFRNSFKPARHATRGGSQG